MYGLMCIGITITSVRDKISTVTIYSLSKMMQMLISLFQLNLQDDLIQLNNFYFRGAHKDISSIWIGKSPELQFALYTVCFLARQGEDCYITVEGGRVMYIQNFTMSGVSPTTIGTVFAFC